MLTQKQEDYLAKLADEGIAEEQAVIDRNAQIILDSKIQAAREATKAQLMVEAQALIDAGLNDFDTNIAPTIS